MRPKTHRRLTVSLQYHKSLEWNLEPVRQSTRRVTAEDLMNISSGFFLGDSRNRR